MESNLTKSEWDSIRAMIKDNNSADLARSILRQKVWGDELDMYRAFFLLQGNIEERNNTTMNVHWSIGHELKAALNDMKPWK